MFLFVYGTLKRGFSGNYLLDKADFVDEGVTLKKYLMISFNKYPAIIEYNNSDIAGFVIGEVFRINNNILKKIDFFEDYPDFYTRKIEKIKLLNSNRIISAWIYILNSQIIIPKNNFLLWK